MLYFFIVVYMYLVLGELSKILCTPLTTVWRINLKPGGIGLSVSDEMDRIVNPLFRRINNRVNRDVMTEAGPAISSIQERRTDLLLFLWEVHNCVGQEAEY